MNLELLFDPLFHIPFLVGLIMAVLLPLLGALLRLRDEWLAALGLAHLAGASGLLGVAAGIPVVLGVTLGALAGALVKSFGHFRGNTIYALMILVGWSATLLLAANTSLGDAMGHALTEGQLYFAGTTRLLAVLGLAVLIIIIMPWVMPRVIRARFFPGYEVSNQLPAWRWHLSFDILVALGMAVGTATLGLIAAFVLVFIPPWLAFSLAKNWYSCLWISVFFSVIGYCTAFILALILDQPFGPVLVAVLVVSASMIILIRS